MKKSTHLILFVIFLLAFQIKGKGQECGTDYIHKQLMLTDSIYRIQFLNLESQIETIIQDQKNEKTQNAIYTIPVVVHVIHLGEAVGTGTNISDSIINLAIKGLNDRFRHVIGNGVDTELEFCLATRDTSGNLATGINRVNGSILPNYQAHGISMVYNNCDAPSESSVKDLSRWPTSDYYNIWVVNQICQGFGGFAGYASYPNGGPYDGTTIISYYMSGTNIVLTHELGHGFFLYHTFNGDGGNTYCPVDTSCLVNGDYVCDTPPHKQGDCSTTNPCTGAGIWSNSLNNTMSYCGIRDRFTQGQKVRMRATAIVLPRASLLNSNGCTDPITQPETPPSTTTAEMSNLFIVSPNPAIHNFTIKFNVAFDVKGAIQIFNILGEKVFEYNYFSLEKEIEIINFSAGMYFIQIGNGPHNVTKKLIVLKD